RLLYSSPTVRDESERLIVAWEQLWDALADMRQELPPDLASEVRRVADSLTLVDVIVDSGGGEIRARLLPTHPAVLEPRTRAAQLFLSQADERPALKFLDVVSAPLDPAAPAICVVYENPPEALAFAGIHRTGLPMYAKHRLASSAQETLKLLRQSVDRFVS